MISSASSRLLSYLALIGALLICSLSSARAQQPAPPAPSRPGTVSDDGPLIIAAGKFTRDGQSRPATVKNLVELIRQRYRNVNITVIDVDDVTVQQLTLHWARYVDSKPEGSPGRVVDPPLEGVLAALAEASGRKFSVSGFGPKDFLLRLPESLHEGSDPVTEVFNLSPFLNQGSRRAAELESQLRDLQIELGVLQKRYAEKHPSVIDLNNRIDLVKAQLADSNRPSKEAVAAAAKLVEDIKAAVDGTLHLQKSVESAPQFQFHPGSNLLVAVGGQNAINVTRKVIAALEKNK